MCESQRSDFLQHVKAQVYARGLFGRLWRCRFLRFLERPRAEPLWSSDAAALAAVDIPLTAEFASALTAASSMGALAAVAGASPAVSAASTWLAWAESSAGFGVSALVAPVAAAADSVAAMHSTCGSVVPSPLLTTGVGAAVLSIGGWASPLLTTGVGAAGLSIGGWTSPLLSAGVGPAVLSTRGTSSRANSYATLFTMVRQRFMSVCCRGTGTSGFSGVTRSKDPSAKTRMNPTGRAMGGRSSCGVCRSGGGAVSTAAGEVGLKSSCALCGHGDATINRACCLCGSRCRCLCIELVSGLQPAPLGSPLHHSFRLQRPPGLSMRTMCPLPI